MVWAITKPTDEVLTLHAWAGFAFAMHKHAIHLILQLIVQELSAWRLHRAICLILRQQGHVKDIVNLHVGWKKELVSDRADATRNLVWTNPSRPELLSSGNLQETDS